MCAGNIIVNVYFYFLVMFLKYIILIDVSIYFLYFIKDFLYISLK